MSRDETPDTHPTPDASPDPAVVTPNTGDVAGEAYYREHGWSGCAGSAWDRLPDATKDGWRHANHVAAAREADRAEADAHVRQVLAANSRAEEADTALTDLVAKIEALADEWESHGGVVRLDQCDLRALIPADAATALDAVREKAKAEERERIAQAIEALPGPEGVGLSKWVHSKAKEGYLLAIEEAAVVARHTPEATT